VYNIMFFYMILRFL